MQLSKSGSVTNIGLLLHYTRKKIMKGKAWEHRPLWMCQQTTNAWKLKKWTVSKTRSRRDSSPCTLHRHRREYNWSLHSLSQRPGIDFHDGVMTAHAGSDFPAYITTLRFSRSWGRHVCFLTLGRIYWLNILLICILRTIHQAIKSEKLWCVFA